MNKHSILFPMAALVIACQPATEKTQPANDSTNTELSATVIQSAPLNIEQQATDFAAHWLDATTVVLAKADSTQQYFLATVIDGQQHSIPLSATAMPEKFSKKHPHLAEFQAFTVSLAPASIKQWLKNPLYVFAENNPQVSFVQTGEVIDAMYTSSEKDANEFANLGAVINEDNLEINLWAPTAKSVKLKLFNKDKSPASPSAVDMTEDSKTGIWHVSLEKDTSGLFYQYQIEVYHPATQKFETIVTTDPYSVSLSTNSEHSQIVSLNDASTQPNGWNQQAEPKLTHTESAVLYEVHIRDFSAIDNQLSNEAHRGKYLAFTEDSSSGMQHIKQLKAAGLNHIHLLPAFDIGTVNEATAIDFNSSIKDVCKLAPSTSVCAQELDDTLTIKQVLDGFDPKTGDAQALVTELKTFDKYNWGYDPFHYTVPEGSYAVNPDGEARIIEFREMVQHLHNLGFRVIMDVVYNHTHKARLESTAVLDKIVPNYYQRLNPITGDIEQSTCCDNTATERVMMEKLMIDSLVVWARDYKIDGFRFDLMGHQPKAAMLKAREAVRKVDPDTYFYGEGWNFGEVANNSQFVQASQLELGGTEIGTFTDRLRDAVRGPGISVQGDDIRRNQGIGNGLATRPNELNDGNETNGPDYQLLMDQLRIGLAGNLANFPLADHDGNKVTGKDVPYGNQPTGYALDPADTVNYVSKHDNQTLWDNNQYRNAIDLTTEERVRLHNQSLSYTLLAQGIPFIHMGSELLRSKSYLRDSYDYSNWFNRVDFAKQQNFYHVGLPPAEKDKANWPLISYLLDNNKGRDIPTSNDIRFASDVFAEFLSIRTGSPLFSLTTGEEVINRVRFLNTGKAQQRGLIAMHIDNSDMAIDENFAEIVVLFNSDVKAKTLMLEGSAGFNLHPIQANGVDKVTQQSRFNNNTFSVPALTTAVFVKPRPNAKQQLIRTIQEGTSGDKETRTFSPMCIFNEQQLGCFFVQRTKQCAN